MHTRTRMPFVTLVACCLVLALAAVGPSPGAVVAASPDVAPVSLTFASDGTHFAGGWAMRLAAVGRGDALVATDAVMPTDDGNRVAYRHAGDVTEWYVRQSSGDGNGANGVEQGVTLAARPAGDGPLALTVVTAGAMALVDEGGATATLVLPDGARWGYTGLQVTDATGRTLPAHLTQAAGGIGITVEDGGAAYPVVVDPFVQRQTLTATGGASNDQFGISVALSPDGSTALVGASGRSNMGAAYVFTRSSGTYSQTQTLTDPAGGANGDYFGNRVALSQDGSTALVGASGRSSRMGAAYVFTRSNGVYSQTQAFIDPAGGVNGDKFGTSAALSQDGSTALVGASGRSSYMGAAYVFTRSSGTYSQTQTLTDPVGGASNDYFGTSVALAADGSTALVGVSGRSNTGTAYVFVNPPALTSIAGTPQSVTVGQPFATPLAVALTDSYGTPLAGVTVTFTAPAGGAGGTFGGATTATTTTDANGLATAPTFTANTVTGNYSVTASATTSGGTATATFSLTNTAGAPASITAVSGSNQTAQLGNAFGAPLRVRVFDAEGNPAPGASVAFTAPTTPNSPTATFGAAAPTDASGYTSVIATAAGRPGIFTATATVAGVATPATFTLADSANSSTVLVTGFSPPTGPTAGGNSVTLTGVNFSGTTSVTFDTTAGTAVTVVNATTITVTAPAHAAGTVDITVMTGSPGQTATIHGYTYVDTGGIAPQPASHPLPGSGGSGGGLPIAQPVRHDDPGNGGGQPHAAEATPVATPAAQPVRH